LQIGTDFELAWNALREECGARPGSVFAATAADAPGHPDHEDVRPSEGEKRLRLQRLCTAERMRKRYQDLVARARTLSPQTICALSPSTISRRRHLSPPYRRPRQLFPQQSSRGQSPYSLGWQTRVWWQRRRPWVIHDSFSKRTWTASSMISATACQNSWGQTTRGPTSTTGFRMSSTRLQSLSACE